MDKGRGLLTLIAWAGVFASSTAWAGENSRHMIFSIVERVPENESEQRAPAQPLPPGIPRLSEEQQASILNLRDSSSLLGEAVMEPAKTSDSKYDASHHKNAKSTAVECGRGYKCDFDFTSGGGILKWGFDLDANMHKAE
jgi:hypothetical protein